MKLMKIFLVCGLSFITSFGLYAQEEGHLKMEITEVSSENPQMQAQLEMMKGSQTEVHFKDGKSLTTMNMMGGMVVTKVLLETGQGLKLIMDMMGQKMLIPMSQQELTQSQNDPANPMNDLTVTYDEADTKDIAGFSCYKMVATPVSNPDMKIEAYITEDIKANAAVIQGVNLENFKGFPLEYTVNMGVMTMTTTTKEYEATVDSEVFNVNTNGYTEMSMEDFMNSIGQMGGGFGF